MNDSSKQHQAPLASQAADPSSMPAIDVRALSCGYEGKVVLENITFNVRPAELFFVIGGSGCGKSTLLRHLIGLNMPSAGEVRFFGQVFGDQGEAQRRELLKTFGVLFQSAPSGARSRCAKMWPSLSNSTPPSPNESARN